MLWFCDVFVPWAACRAVSMSRAESCCCISSQGACAQNSASSLHFFAARGNDVLRWLLIVGKAFCGCSSCFIAVHCWSHPCFQYFPCSPFGVGSAPCSVPCTGLRAVFACSCPSPRGWFRACIALPPLLEHVCAAPAAVLQRSLGHIVSWIVSPAIPPLPRRSYAALGSLSFTRARRCPRVGIFFLTCLWQGQVPRLVVLVPLDLSLFVSVSTLFLLSEPVAQ